MSNKLYDFTKYTKMYGYTDEQKINNQRKRADKWAKKYSEDLKNYKKLIIENEQLRQTNHELNLMHHQAIMKVLHLGQQLKKEKEND
tara:strand:+ start:870 stop:1130 length:261 start_codon:yes stop_codon:yes gene_type:complete